MQKVIYRLDTRFLRSSSTTLLQNVHGVALLFLRAKRTCLVLGEPSRRVSALMVIPAIVLSLTFSGLLLAIFRIECVGIEVSSPFENTTAVACVFISGGDRGSSFDDLRGTGCSVLFFCTGVPSSKVRSYDSSSSSLSLLMLIMFLMTLSSSIFVVTDSCYINLGLSSASCWDIISLGGDYKCFLLLLSLKRAVIFLSSLLLIIDSFETVSCSTIRLGDV